MNRRRIICIFVTVGVLCAAFFSFLIVKINCEYPAPEQQIAGIGEALTINGLSLVCNSTEILSGDEYKEKFDLDNDAEADSVIVVAEFLIKNTNSTAIDLFQGKQIIFLELQLGYGATFYNLYDIANINPNMQNGLKTVLQPGEATTIIFSFSDYKSCHTDAQWNAIKTMPYDFVLSLYPVKKVVHIEK